jgi:hypothetical protein
MLKKHTASFYHISFRESTPGQEWIKPFLKLSNWKEQVFDGRFFSQIKYHLVSSESILGHFMS